MSDYLGQGIVDFTVRPIRLAYLIERGSEDGFRLAVEEATTRWGGMSELIVPYRPDGTVDEYWVAAVALNPPDHLAVTAGIDAAVQSRLSETLMVQVQQIKVFSDGQYGNGLNQNLVKPPAERADYVLMDVADMAAPPLRLAALGCVAARNVGLWHDLGAPLRAVDSFGMPETMAQSRGSTAIEGTRRQLQELTGSGIPNPPAVVWVAEEESLEDAIAFWNLRALTMIRPNRPLAWAVTPAIFREAHFQQLLEQGIRRHWESIEPDIGLGSVSLDGNTLAEMVAAALPAVPGVPWKVYEGSSIKYGRPPVDGTPPEGRIYTTDLQFLRWSVHRPRRIGQNTRVPVQLHRRRTIVATDSPVAFARLEFAPVVMAGLSGVYDLSLPKGASYGPLFHDNARAVEGVVEFTTAAQPRYEFEIRIPTRADLLMAYLAEKGVAGVVSDKGRLAEGVVALVQDLEPLRSQAVLKVVDALTTHRVEYDIKALKKQMYGASEEGLRRMAEGLQDVRQTSRPLQGIVSLVGGDLKTATAAVEALVAGGMAIRGFQLVCSVCGMKLFLEIRDVDPLPVCPGCGSRADFPRDQGSGEPAIYYRLNTLVDRASDNGVMVHLLAVAGLRRRDQQGHVVPGMKFPSLADREADVVGLLGTEIWVGEAKTGAASFTEAQVERDVDLAKRIRADHYMMVSLEEIAEGVKKIAVEKCLAAGIKVWSLEGASGDLIQVMPRPPLLQQDNPENQDPSTQG